MRTGHWIILAALVPAVIDWVAVRRRRKRMEYIFKPATLLTFLAGASLLARDPSSGWQARFFLIGLICSLVGDLFLMLPDEQRYFVPGLGAFLLAHVGYIIGLNRSPPPLTSLLLWIPVAGLGGWLTRAIVAGARRRGQGDLVAPVVVYSIALSLMLFSAWATLFRPTWGAPQRLLVILGGSLFFASDTMLAWDRFVHPSTTLRQAVIVTYHLGQMALAASIAR